MLKLLPLISLVLFTPPNALKRQRMLLILHTNCLISFIFLGIKYFQMLTGNNIIEKKSFDFSLETIKLYKYLCIEKKEYVLSKQILRSGTSIGANINEAHSAESKKDFIHKFGIAQKETRETLY